MIAFAFSSTNSERILQNIEAPNLDKYYIESSVSSVNSFLNKIRDREKVVGVGQYYGRDQDKVRIEQVAKNKFRNNPISNDGPNEIRLIPVQNLRDKNIKYTKGMGNSWCNLVAYRIAVEKQPEHLTFLHVPRDLDLDLAAELIEKII